MEQRVIHAVVRIEQTVTPNRRNHSPSDAVAMDGQMSGIG